jgi:Winged helix-turn helix
MLEEEEEIPPSPMARMKPPIVPDQPVQAVLGGMSQAEAARMLRAHPNAVNRWIKRYRDGGWDGLGERRRGRLVHHVLVHDRHGARSAFLVP